MKVTELEKKLAELRTILAKLEGEETEKILVKRLRNDMHDDFRENEGAKLVMEDHEMLHLRIYRLKREMVDLKRQIIRLKMDGGR